MGGGFRWDVYFRITPDNGPVQTIHLDENVLTDARGPVGTIPSYRLEEETEADVLREIRQVPFGWRAGVSLAFELRSMTDQAQLAAIINALTKPGRKVELSLDGGATYREVVMEGGFSPQQLGGKWTAGVRYELALTCKELLEETPSIATVDASGRANVW